MLKLKHIVNSVVISEIVLAEGDFSIGRNAGNSLQLDGTVVSGDHAVLILVANEYMPEVLDITVKDLNSTNGVYVNNIKVIIHKLKHDDVIRIGSHEFKIFDEAQSNTGTQTEYYVEDDE